jgi:tyrosinase
MARIRRDVWALSADPNDTTLLWYGRAVRAMQALPITDPRSWRYQAAIHDYSSGADPLATPGEQLPPAPERQRFWRQCQHNSWFFLPWHRMYLHHFETIVAAHVVALGGPAGWTLPYWNYSKDLASRRLPPAFRDSVVAGAPNPLFVAERAAAANAGQDFAEDADVALDVTLRAAPFSNSPFSGEPGFGGPQTAFNHSSGPIGALEFVPHGLMHGAVAGDFGWMGAFNTAALDPIFWLHHANIDRLWEVWLRRDPTNQNPSQAFWRTGVRFEFRAVDGNAVSMASSDVLDTTAPPLDYSYEDVSDPLDVLESAAPGTLGAVASQSMPEMVGATHAPIVLGDEPKHALIPTALPPATELESAQEDKRVYLHIENMTSERRAHAYDVYLGIPPGEDPTAHPDRRAGRLSMFGLTEASKSDGPNAGSGLTQALEVTDLVRRLRDLAGWSASELGVAFVPVTRGAGSSLESARPASEVRVGRVSLYVK